MDVKIVEKPKPQDEIVIDGLKWGKHVQTKQLGSSEWTLTLTRAEVFDLYKQFKKLHLI